MYTVVVTRWSGRDTDNLCMACQTVQSQTGQSLLWLPQLAMITLQDMSLSVSHQSQGLTRRRRLPAVSALNQSAAMVTAGQDTGMLLAVMVAAIDSSNTFRLSLVIGTLQPYAALLGMLESQACSYMHS